MTTPAERIATADAELRERARGVIPGGMYGHQSTRALPPGFPQFFARAEGTRLWDVDGNEYVDVMCAYGPMILGYRHPRVEAAAGAQAELADCANGPAPVIVELAELLVDTIRDADWAMFQKNGTDATTTALTIARSATGRRRILAATGAYHGSAPWCTPRPGGVTPEDRANLLYYRFNDLASARAAADEAGDDLAGVIVSPFKHDASFDQELVDPEFARGLRELCDARGAALILDEVRAGFRLAHGGSWERLGVASDLSAWSKALANGHPLAAVTGTDAMREGAEGIFVTGSFWFAAVPMAAALATLAELREADGVAAMERAGQRLREGLAAQAAEHGVEIRQTGPAQMPYLTFVGDVDHQLGDVFCATAAAGGAYLHPRHNWFLSAAHTDADIDRVLEATAPAFRAVAQQLS